MNSNFLQTLLTIIAAVSAIFTSLLVAMGCVDTGASLSCSATHAPTWLVPYLALAASIVTVLKLLIGALTGKLVAPTIVATAQKKR